MVFLAPAQLLAQVGLLHTNCIEKQLPRPSLYNSLDTQAMYYIIIYVQYK